MTDDITTYCGFKIFYTCMYAQINPYLTLHMCHVETNKYYLKI